MTEYDLKGTKVLMIVAYHNFRDEEYEIPRKILEKAGAEIDVASSSLGLAQGKLGMTVDIDILLEDVLVKDYDAFVFVGGPGASEFFGNKDAMILIKQADEDHKIIAAICIAPVILAYADILHNKHAAVTPSEAYTIKEKGALYSGKKTEVDGMGNIITADGPEVASEFADLIAQALEKAKSRK